MLFLLALIMGLGLIAGCESMTPVEPESVGNSWLDEEFVTIAVDLAELEEVLQQLAENEELSGLIEQAATEQGIDLPQNDRGNAWWWYVNRAIWNRAHRDIGHYVGVECKPWANRVVKSATGFNLPRTQNNDMYFDSGHSFMIVDGHTVGGGTIKRGVGIGNIVQMKIISSSYVGPHTAIFYRYTTPAEKRYNGWNGMLLIDSNFFISSWPKYVYVHYVPWSWWDDKVWNRYSVYQAQNW